jgi:hypothetical protein
MWWSILPISGHGVLAVERDHLIEQARELRQKWHAGEYVSITAAISLANRLADAVESREDGQPGHKDRVA